MQEDFSIPLDEPLLYADLLLSVSMVLFQQKGPDFFYIRRTQNPGVAVPQNGCTRVFPILPVQIYATRNLYFATL